MRIIENAIECYWYNEGYILLTVYVFFCVLKFHFNARAFRFRNFYSYYTQTLSSLSITFFMRFCGVNENNNSSDQRTSSLLCKWSILHSPHWICKNVTNIFRYRRMSIGPHMNIYPNRYLHFNEWSNKRMYIWIQWQKLKKKKQTDEAGLFVWENAGERYEFLFRKRVKTHCHVSFFFSCSWVHTHLICVCISLIWYAFTCVVTHGHQHTYVRIFFVYVYYT